MAEETNRRRRATVPRPERLRRLRGAAFGWIDARMHRAGWLRLLSAEDVAVYAFLCLVANHDGVSYYRRDRIALELGLGEREVAVALRRLSKLELTAYQPFHLNAADGFHQVLAVPEGKAPARFGA